MKICVRNFKCVLLDLITKEIPFKFIPKSIVDDNYHGLKTLCPCSFDRTHGFASLICEYHDKKFNDIFSNDVSQRCQELFQSYRL